MGARYTTPRPFEIDSNGFPLDGAKLTFFITLTSTPKDTFSDSTLGTPNTNPVIADGNGRFGTIFLDGVYKVELKDKDDNVIFTDDPITDGSIITINQELRGTKTDGSLVNLISIDSSNNVQLTSTNIDVVCNSTFRMIHDRGIAGKTSGGTDRSMLILDSTDRIKVGSDNQPLTLRNDGDCILNNHAGTASESLHALTLFAYGEINSDATVDSNINISGAVKNSTGDYTITLTDAASSTANMIGWCGDKGTSVGVTTMRVYKWDPSTTTTIDIKVQRSDDGSVQDDTFYFFCMDVGA